MSGKGKPPPPRSGSSSRASPVGPASARPGRRGSSSFSTPGFPLDAVEAPASATAPGRGRGVAPRGCDYSGSKRTPRSGGAAGCSLEAVFLSGDFTRAATSSLPPAGGPTGGRTGPFCEPGLSAATATGGRGRSEGSPGAGEQLRRSAALSGCGGASGRARCTSSRLPQTSHANTRTTLPAPSVAIFPSAPSATPYSSPCGAAAPRAPCRRARRRAEAAVLAGRQHARPVVGERGPS